MTSRSISALNLLFPDQTSGDISPQDDRDLIATFTPGYAQMFISSSAPTTIAVATTFVKAAGTTTLTTDPTALNWTMPTDNRLAYGGTPDRVVMVTCAISLQAVGTNVDLKWRLAKTGTTIADTEITRKVVVASENGAAAISGLVEMSNGDYLELWTANDTDTTNLTVTNMVMSVMDFPT